MAGGGLFGIAEDFVQQDIDSAQSTAIGGEVETAFLDGFGRLPPPASGAFVFAGLNGAGAGIAANAGVSGCIERMLGKFVLFRVSEDIFRGPVGERADFDLRTGAVEDFDGSPGFGLCAAQSGE